MSMIHLQVDKCGCNTQLPRLPDYISAPKQAHTHSHLTQLQLEKGVEKSLPQNKVLNYDHNRVITRDKCNFCRKAPIFRGSK